MYAIHFKNEFEEEKPTPKGLSLVDRDSYTYRTSAWAINQKDAAALVGGWVYLHKTKGHGAHFGGKVRSFHVIEEGTDRGRIALTFIATREARGVAWRGADHGMAWQSGLVKAGLPHEAH